MPVRPYALYSSLIAIRPRPAAGRVLSRLTRDDRDEYGHALQEAQKQLSYGRIVEFVAQAIISSHEEEKTGKAEIGT